MYALGFRENFFRTKKMTTYLYLFTAAQMGILYNNHGILGH